METNTKYRLTLVSAGIGLLLGVYAVVMILAKGHAGTTNTSSLSPWGLQIITYIYIVLIGTGCTFINFFGHIYREEEFKPVATRVSFLAILMVFAGLGALVTELGKPWRILNFALSPNVTSPMWGMFFFYNVYIVFIVLEYFSLRRGRVKTWIMWGAFLSAIATYITMGSIFAISEARPYYFGALTAVYTPIVAFLTGCALVMLAILLGKDANPRLQASLEPVRRLMLVALGLVLLTGLWRFIIGSWAMAEGYEVFAITAPRFLIVGVLFGILLPAVLAFTRKTSNLFLAAVTVLVTQFVSRYDFVLDGFLVPVFRGLSDPPFVHYTSALNEVFIAVAAASFVLFFYAIAEKKGALESTLSQEG
jgi:molybdopterin-containing oxidoreductase family membrane subunit